MLTNEAGVLSEMGENKKALIKLDEAEKNIKKALSIEPNNGAFIDSLGWVYYKKGMLEKAKTELEKAIKILKDDPVIYEHLGDVYFKIGDHKRAREMWKKSLQLDPKNQSLKKKLDNELKIQR